MLRLTGALELVNAWGCVTCREGTGVPGPQVRGVRGLVRAEDGEAQVSEQGRCLPGEGGAPHALRRRRSETLYPQVKPQRCSLLSSLCAPCVTWAFMWRRVWKDL